MVLWFGRPVVRSGLAVRKIAGVRNGSKRKGVGWGGFRRTELCRRNERTMDSSCCMVIYSMFILFFVYCANNAVGPCFRCFQLVLRI